MRAEETLDQKRGQLELPHVVADPRPPHHRRPRMDEAQDEVDKLYARWAELESKQNA